MGWYPWIGDRLGGEAAGLGIAVGVAVGALVTWFAIRSIAWVSRGLERRAEKWTWLHSIRFRYQEVVPREEVAKLFASLIRIARYAVNALLLVAYLNFVFALFEPTREIAVWAIEQVTAVTRRVGWAIVDYLPDLALVIAIVVVTRFLIHLAKLFFDSIRSGRLRLGGFYPEWSQPTFNMIRILFIVFAAIVAFPYLPGAGSPAFQGVSLFLGLLVSLGSTVAVANIIGGVVLTYTRAFQVGDRIRIADAEGDVIEKTMFVTRLLSPKKLEISIPNAMVLGGHVTNYSARARRGGMLLHTEVTLGYDVPWRQVHDILIRAAGEVDGIEAEPEPFVLQRGLDDFYVRYELNAYTRKPEEMARIYSDLHAHVQDGLHRGGIEITSPRFLALRDGNASTIPSVPDPEAPTATSDPTASGEAR